MNKRLKAWIRKHWRWLAGAGCAALLAGCATVPNTTTATYNACKDLHTAIPGLTGLKPYMSAATAATFNNALTAAVTDCKTIPYPANTQAAITNALTIGTTEALKLKTEVKK